VRNKINMKKIFDEEFVNKYKGNFQADFFSANSYIMKKEVWKTISELIERCQQLEQRMYKIYKLLRKQNNKT